MAVLRHLNVQLQLLADDFNNGLKAAQKEAKEFEKTIKPTKEFAKELGTAMTAAGLAVVGSMTAMAKAAANYGSELRDASVRSGSTVQELAKLRFAAEQSGASFDDVSSGLRVLAGNAQAAAMGSKAQAAAFRDLGIAVTDSSGRIRPLNSLLTDVADRFSRMEDGAEKSAIAVELFGRGGTALIPTLNKGRDGLREMGDEAERLGLVITDEAAAAGQDFNDTLDQMTSAMQGLANVVGAAIIPGLTALATKTRDIIIAFKDWTKEHEGLTKALFGTGAALLGAGGLALGLASVLSLLPKVSAAIAGLAATISPLAVAIGAAAGAVIFFRNEILIGLRGALATTVKVLEDFTGAVAGMADKIGANGLGIKLHEASFSLGTFRRELEASNAAAMAQSMVIPATAKAMEGARKSADDYTFSLKRTNEEAEKTKEKLAELRAELQRNQLAFERSASIDLFKSTRDAAEEEEKAMRRLNQQQVEVVKTRIELNKEATDLQLKNNRRIQEELEDGLVFTNKMTLANIKKEMEERNRAIEENKRRLEKATDDIKRSAGAVFDAMFLKGESVFKSLGNALKGGALSLGRAIFEDITGALLGPVKKAFDDFIGGIIGKLTGSLGNKLGGLFGLGGSAASAAGSIGGAASGAGGAASSAVGGTLSGALGGIIGGGISAVGSLLGSARLEGTMNAVEFNTRSTRINLEILINEFMHPFKGHLEWIAASGREHTNQLDAIYNAIIGAGGMSPSGGIRMTGLATAQAAGTVVNVTLTPTYAPSFTFTGIPQNLQALITDVIEPRLITDLENNNRGFLEDLARLLKGAAPGIVTGLA